MAQCAITCFEIEQSTVHSRTRAKWDASEGSAVLS